MSHVAFKQLPLRASRSTRLPQVVHWVIFGMFLVQFAFVLIGLWRPSASLAEDRWPQGLLLVLAAATTLASLARQLPAQNVMLASLVIALIAGAFQTLGALTAIPFGPYVYTSQMGPQILYALPWAVPVIWVVAILNSRGVGRLILRPWRRTRAYGFWLMGVTVLLVVLFDLGLELFATRVNHYWLWNPTRLHSTWYGVPWVNFPGWALTSLLILAFATPSLINKKPVKHPPDYHPLAVWLMLTVLFAAGAGAHQLWPATALLLGTVLAAALFAWRGAAW